jgi:hypothetical protein
MPEEIKNAPENNEQNNQKAAETTVTLAELEALKAASEAKIAELREENRKIARAMEGYKVQAKTKTGADETQWEERVKSVQTEYEQKLGALTQRVHETQRSAFENELKSAFSQAGAVDPKYMIFLAREEGLIKESTSDHGDLNLGLVGLDGKSEIREGESNWRKLTASDLAKAMRDSGKFNHIFKSDKPAGHGAVSPGSVIAHNKYQEAYDRELAGSRSAFKLTQIEQAAKQQGIKLKT